MRVPNWVLAAGLTSVVALGAGASWASGGNPIGSTSTAPVSLGLTNGCASISTFSNTTGYYAVWSAIWTKMAIVDNCGVPLDWRMDYTNNATKVVEFSRGSSTRYMSTGTIDYDWGSFATTYTVSLIVKSSTGTIMAQTSAGVTTKRPKDLLATVQAAAATADAAAAAAYAVYLPTLTAATAAQAQSDADGLITSAAAAAHTFAVAAAVPYDTALATANALSATANAALPDATAALALITDPNDPALGAATALVATLTDAAGLAATAASLAAPFDLAVAFATAAQVAATLISDASAAAALAAAGVRDAAYLIYYPLQQAAISADATYQAILAAAIAAP